MSSLDKLPVSSLSGCFFSSPVISVVVFCLFGLGFVVVVVGVGVGE